MLERELFESTAYAECNECGKGVGPSDNDVPDDEDDTRLPVGWAMITIRMVTDNPDRAIEEAEIDAMHATRDEMVDAQVSMALAQIGQEQQPTADQIAMLRGQIAKVVALQAPIPQPEQPEHVVREWQFALCQEHVGLLDRLRLEDFDLSPPVAPVSAAPEPVEDDPENDIDEEPTPDAG